MPRLEISVDHPSTAWVGIASQLSVIGCGGMSINSHHHNLPPCFFAGAFELAHATLMAFVIGCNAVHFTASFCILRFEFGFLFANVSLVPYLVSAGGFDEMKFAHDPAEIWCQCVNSAIKNLRLDRPLWCRHSPFCKQLPFCTNGFCKESRAPGCTRAQQNGTCTLFCVERVLVRAQRLMCLPPCTLRCQAALRWSCCANC